MTTEENDRAEQERRRIAALREHAAERNSKLIPETPGTVRTDGPRRQWRTEVRNGMLVSTEE